LAVCVVSLGLVKITGRAVVAVYRADDDRRLEQHAASGHSISRVSS